MTCSDKQDSQHKCTTAWNDYEAAIEQLKATGLSLDYRNKTIAWKPTPVEDRTPYLAVFTNAYRGYLHASSELTRHLSKHRC
jgi:hypothetical protein